MFDAETVLDMGRRMSFVAINLAVTMLLDVLVLLQPIRNNVRIFGTLPWLEKILFIC